MELPEIPKNGVSIVDSPIVYWTEYMRLHDRMVEKINDEISEFRAKSMMKVVVGFCAICVGLFSAGFALGYYI